MKLWAFAALLAGTIISPLAAKDLVLAIGGEPETGFDPLLGWGSYGNPLFQSTLWARDADLVTQPDLAVEWHLSPDRLRWTMRLREGVKFADGSALSAHDVAFTFNQAKAAAGSVDLQLMQSARALDDLTVEFTLSKPWITFVEAFYTLGIVPAAAYGPSYGRAPLGSGPYQLVSWAEGEQLIVRKNPHYYGRTSDFEQITFVFLGADTALAGAKSGQIDLLSLPLPMSDVTLAAYHKDARKTVDNRGISLPFLPAAKGGNDVTSDLAVRKALNLALDRQLIVDVALFGHGEVAFGPADGLPWAGDAPIVADSIAAEQLLEAAGWQRAADGIRQKGDVRAAFDLYYPASDPARQALAEVTADLLRPLGFAVTPKGASWEVIGRNMKAQPVVFGFGSHSPYQIYSIYSQSLAGVDYANPTFYSNALAEEAFGRAQAAGDLESSYPLWAEAARHYGLAGDNAYLWLANIDHVYLVSDCLDLGPAQIEPHGHGWPITAGLAHWKWTCS